MSGVSSLYLYYYVIVRIGGIVRLPDVYKRQRQAGDCDFDVYIFFAVTQVYFAVAHFNELCCGQFVIGIDGAVDVNIEIKMCIRDRSNTTKKETKNGSWNECSENTERAVIIEKNPEALLQSCLLYTSI